MLVLRFFATISRFFCFNHVIKIYTVNHVIKNYTVNHVIKNYTVNHVIKLYSKSLDSKVKEAKKNREIVAKNLKTNISEKNCG